MPSRRLWALMLLTAVFVMHGVPLLGGSGEHGGVVLGSHAGAQDSSEVADPMVSSPMSPEPMLAALRVTAPAVEQIAVITDGRGAGAPGDRMPSHVWAACLAVLLIGVVLLGAGALARSWATSSLDELLGGARRLRHRPLVERPPDLSALCLLRI